MSNDVIYSKQGDTVDSICYKHYGYTAGITEKVLDVNTKLAQLGAVLPVGTKVILPPDTVKTTKTTVNLWD